MAQLKFCIQPFKNATFYEVQINYIIFDEKFKFKIYNMIKSSNSTDNLYYVYHSGLFGGAENDA